MPPSAGVGFDALVLNEALSSISLALCHVHELIGLAYQLSCEIHPSDPPDAILRTGGRLATLMHVSEQQLHAMQAELGQMMTALNGSAHRCHSE